MTKEEIKQLIAEKIAGQGSAIDAASVLPAILNAILDLPAPEPDPQDIAGALTLRCKPDISGTESGLSKGQMCSTLGISTGELDKLFAGVYRWYSGAGAGAGTIVPLVQIDKGRYVAFSYDDYVDYDPVEGTYSYSLGN